MTPEWLAFIVLAVASAATAIGVIAFKNAVHSALSLILTLLFLALFYLQLQAMFIAVVQILILSNQSQRSGPCVNVAGVARTPKQGKRRRPFRR